MATIAVGREAMAIVATAITSRIIGRFIIIGLLTTARLLQRGPGVLFWVWIPLTSRDCCESANWPGE